MNPNLTITQAALAGLLDALYPNPDDPGPYGPIGPVIRDGSWAMLNPQPLPPIAGRLPDPWRRMAWALLNPQPLPPVDVHPDPWRFALITRSVIDHAVALGRSAETAVHEDRGNRLMESARATVRQFIDECGTVIPRPPLPWPWPLRVEYRAHPVELLVAGSQFHKAGTFGGALSADFARAAGDLFEMGLKQLAGRGQAEALTMTA